MSNILKLLSARVVERREALRLSQRELAEKAGFSIGVVRGIEQGKSWPNLKNLVSLCRELKCEPLDLFQTGEAPAPIAQDHPLSECVERLAAVALGEEAQRLPEEAHKGVVPHRAPEEHEADWVLGSILATPGGLERLRALLDVWETTQAKRKEK